MARPGFTIGLDVAQADDYTAAAVVQRIRPPIDAAEGAESPTEAYQAVFKALEGAKKSEALQIWNTQMRYVEGWEKLISWVKDLIKAEILPPQERDFKPVYHLRHLERWRQKPYTEIANRVVRLVNQAQLRGDNDLVIDHTGVGAAVTDLIKEKLRGAAVRTMVPVIITGGIEERYEKGTHRVPKRNLIAPTVVALQTGRLLIAEQLPEAQTLVSELETFRYEISESTGHDTYGADWRTGMHDDLVLALCLALWWNERPRGVFLV